MEFSIYWRDSWFIFLLEIKEINYLYKNSEEDDCYNSSQEHVLHVAVCEQETKWEGYSPTKATVGNNKLVLFGQLHNPELINDECKTNNSWSETEFE